MLDLSRFPYIDAATGVISIDAKTYPINDLTMLVNAKGSLIAVGKTNIETALTAGLNKDVISKVETDANGIVTRLTASSVKSETDAAQAVINLLNADAMNPEHVSFNTSGEVAAARTAYNALPQSQKDLVTNYAKLTAAEAVLANADAADVAADKAALDADAIKNANTALNNVVSNLNLITTGTEEGSTIVWASSKPAVVTTGGVVTQPDYADGDATVTLTATIKKGLVEDTKVFTVTVKAESALVDVNAASDATDMRAALQAIVTKGDFNAASISAWNGLVSGQRDLVAADVYANLGSGYADLPALQTAFNTALGL